MSVPPRLAQTLRWTGWMHTGVKAFSLGTAEEEVTLSLFTKQKKTPNNAFNSASPSHRGSD